jgi:hypothetical protein
MSTYEQVKTVAFARLLASQVNGGISIGQTEMAGQCRTNDTSELFRGSFIVF